MKILFKNIVCVPSLTQDEAFNPPSRRYEEMGQYSIEVAAIKRHIIGEMFAVAELRVNYRLQLLLGKFKERILALKAAAGKGGKRAGQGGGGGGCGGFLVAPEEIGNWASSLEMFHEFEGLFTLEVLEVYPRPL